MAMWKKISHTHNKKSPRENIPLYPPINRETFRSTLILTRTSDTKPNLQGIKIVTALLSPGQWAVQPLHGWMLYSQMHCLKGEEEAGCSGEQ